MAPLANNNKNILRGKDQVCFAQTNLTTTATRTLMKEDVAPLLKELMIDPIEHRWAQHVAVTTFRCRHGTAPPDLRKKLKSVDHGRTTRGASGNYVPYRSSSTSGTVSFSNRAPLIWNSLPNELQEAGSVNCFKRLYLKLLSDPHSANALDLAINCPHY